MATTIEAALITTYGTPPTYTTVYLPSPTPSQIQLKVLATGLHNLVRSRASGTHYTSPPLPQIPGVDGIGLAPDGKKYYFTSLATGGTFATHINVDLSALTPLPPNADPTQTAALVNPATSSWMAIKARAANLPKPFNALILGATSASGRLAIPLARSLGAGKIFGAARDASALSSLPLDGTLTVSAHDASETDFAPLAETQIDLVLDYVNGDLPAAFLSKHEQTAAMQYVHIGTLSGKEMALPGSVLRSKDLTIRGSGPGAWSLRELKGEMPALLEALGGVEEQRARVVGLQDVEGEWGRRGEGERVVFVP